MAQDSRVAQAIELVRQIFGDTSVPPSTTKERLEEIQEEIQSQLDCLREDERSLGDISEEDDV